MTRHDGPGRPGDIAEPDPESPEEQARQRLREQHQGVPRDVGRTGGGGSLGHKQPPEVTSEGPAKGSALDIPTSP